MFREMIEAGQQILEREIQQATAAAKEYDAKGATLKAASRRNKAIDYTLRLSRLTSWSEERAARMPTPKTPPAAVVYFHKCGAVAGGW